MNDRDPEEWVPAQLRAVLGQAWPGLYVSRDRDEQLPAVTVIRAGGPFERVTDSWRLLVNVYAADDDQANRLGYQVASVLERLTRRAGVKGTQINAPVVVPTTATEPRQRFIAADLRTRRTVH